VPKTANSAKLDASVGINRGHTLEVSRVWAKGTDHEGNMRVLGFYNLASMGSYTLAINPANLIDGKPDITSVRQAGRTKKGWGISADKKLAGGWILFGRAGYNDGKNETWAFTEIEQTASLGITRSGERWKRPLDVVGVAYAANGINSGHRKYLAAGGTGFMLGDGALNYGPEMAFEFFYKFQAHEEHFYITPDYQFIMNPGYNKDRGPVHVFALRVHTEF
jgi:high affinity Mn2+ porin